MMDSDIVERAERVTEKLAVARKRIGEVVFGQDELVISALTTLVAGGHGLLVGPPGLAKTLLVTTSAQVLSLDAKRVQFTPDLMPSDILGAEVLEESASGGRAFRFIKGPVFCQLLMADEINRASPRTQSALLQAMQERDVTIAGTHHPLPRPFHVLATQNPLEQEGTYPLPEAQLDRFLMQIDVAYPDRDTERRVLLETTGPVTTEPQPAMTAEDLMEAQDLARRTPVGERVVEEALNIVRHARPGEGTSEMADAHVSWGPGPRAGQALILCARSRALIDGRFAPSVDDIHALARPVLRHRIELTYGAKAKGVRVHDVIDSLINEAA